MSTHLPPVHRSVRTGGWLLLVGAVQFVVAMIVVQADYPGYSLMTNYISDLGNTVLSPAHLVFNLSIIALGLMAIGGILLAWGAFPGRSLRLTGLGLLLLASVAAIFVGVFPENVNAGYHGLASLLVFLPGGLGLVAVGGAMGEENHWAWLRGPSIVLGLVTLASLAVYLFTSFGSSQYPGFVERLVVYPILLWALLAGAHLVRLPIRARAMHHLVPGATP